MNWKHVLGKKATCCPTRRSSTLQCSECNHTWLDQPSEHQPSHTAQVQSAPEHHGITLPWEQQPPPLWDHHQARVPQLSSFHWVMPTPGHSASRETHKWVVIKGIVRQNYSMKKKILNPGKANCRKTWSQPWGHKKTDVKMQRTNVFFRSTEDWTKIKTMVQNSGWKFKKKKKALKYRWREWLSQ